MCLLFWCSDSKCLLVSWNFSHCDCQPYLLSSHKVLVLPLIQNWQWFFSVATVKSFCFFFQHVNVSEVTFGTNFAVSQHSSDNDGSLDYWRSPHHRACLIILTVIFIPAWYFIVIFNLWDYFLYVWSLFFTEDERDGTLYCANDLNYWVVHFMIALTRVISKF